MGEGRPSLDTEKLDCYRLATEFLALAPRLLPKRGCAGLRDQLDRASVSQARSLLVRIVQMLSRLIARMAERPA